MDNQPESDFSDGNDLVPPILRRQQDAEDEDEWEDEEDLGSRKLRDVFQSLRVDPILRTSAEINGLEYMSEPKEVEPGTLRYGSLGLRRQAAEPIMRLPLEVAQVLADAGRRLE
jgi:hypothetical protein